jgi:type II secretory pathway pseudopilin PulG
MIPITDSRRTTRAFTLAELLIVMVIIVLLIGLLLPALNKVYKNGVKAAEKSQIQALVVACESYTLAFGAAPGYFAESDYTPAFAANFSPNESLVCSLLGTIVPTPQAGPNKFIPSGAPASFTAGAGHAIDLDRVGPGPSVNGRVYGAFWSAKAGELAAVTGLNSNPMPEIVDIRTGVPLLYYRSRTLGPATTTITSAAQPSAASSLFGLRDNASYLEAPVLKTSDGRSFDESKSLIRSGAPADVSNLAYVLTNSALSTGANLSPASQSRGGFTLISAGYDGVYFSSAEQPTITSYDNLKKFDDVQQSGGTN